MDMSHLEASVRREPGSAVLNLRGEINGSDLDSASAPSLATAQERCAWNG
jgi:hypothetical protein